MFYTKNTINHQSSFIETTLLRKYKYDETKKIVSDWKFWIQTIIMENSTYKAIDCFITYFDSSGISLTNHNLRNIENEKVLKELIPERILIDYQWYCKGWESDLYNELRRSRFHRYFYTLNVLIIRTLSIFKKGPCWIKKYPLSIEK